MTHTIYIEDGCHIYEIGCRNTRAEADEAADAQIRDPLQRGRFFFVLSRGAAGIELPTSRRLPGLLTDEPSGISRNTCVVEPEGGSASCCHDQAQQTSAPEQGP